MESHITLATLLLELDNVLTKMDEGTRIGALNSLRSLLHTHSLFQEEPVDNVQWILTEQIEANDYNPNTMAARESALLTRSLEADGFTQPLVVRRCENTKRYVIVDGFHRYSLCCNGPLRKRFRGYVPVVIQEDPDQYAVVATTIRHNRARGQHQIQAMSGLVRELALSGWTNERIAFELGMEQDEVLRLKQLNGLTELFSDRSFSQAWTV
ncbi:IbrB-like domain-containing protein [Rahnella laticis]|uniref:IbrB-like domain-containing protein n=1 Tax=Rahnella laticis TaxID=2787622 RepID=UPI0018A2DCEA|nr:ParB/RepB/Spo0J family partition protein [Rahnella laticis]MBF7997505.1 ParB-like nuclease domain-containing protein [Rahnella laticis]